MPREERMFGDVIDPSVRVGNRQRTAVLLTVVLESALLSVLVVVPLIAVDILPAPHEAIDAFVLDPATPEPPPPPRPAARSPQPEQPPVNADAAPIEPPRELTPEPPRAVSEPPVDAIVGGGDLTGVFGEPAGLGVISAPPPVQAPADPVRVGGRISAPRKIRDAAPVYPEIARSARVEGIVIVEATIDAEGRVSNARVLRGHPLLDGAALEAVRQWQFEPSRLNGEAIPVIMTVTVNFRLF